MEGTCEEERRGTVFCRHFHSMVTNLMDIVASFMQMFISFLPLDSFLAISSFRHICVNVFAPKCRETFARMLVHPKGSQITFRNMPYQVSHESEMLLVQAARHALAWRRETHEPFGAPLPWLGRILLQVPGASEACQETLAYALANATGAELLCIDSSMLAQLEAVALSGAGQAQAAAVQGPQQRGLASGQVTGAAPTQASVAAPSSVAAPVSEGVGLFGYLLSFFLSGGRQAFVMDILHKLSCEVQGPLVVFIRDVEATLCSSPERYLAFRDAFGGTSHMPAPATLAPAPTSPPTPASWRQGGGYVLDPPCVAADIGIDGDPAARGGASAHDVAGQSPEGKGRQARRRRGQMVLVGLSRLNDADGSVVGGGASGGSQRGDVGAPAGGLPDWDEIRAAGGAHPAWSGEPSSFAAEVAVLGGVGVGGSSVFGGGGKPTVRALLSALFSTRVRMGPPGSDSAAFASWQRRMRADEDAARRARVRATLQRMAAARNLQLPPLLGWRGDELGGHGGDSSAAVYSMNSVTGSKVNDYTDHGDVGNSEGCEELGGGYGDISGQGNMGSQCMDSASRREEAEEEGEEGVEDILEAGCQLSSPQEWAKVLTWALSLHLSACAPDPDMIPSTCIHAMHRACATPPPAALEQAASGGDRAKATALPASAITPAVTPASSLGDMSLPNPVLLARGKAGAPSGNSLSAPGVNGVDGEMPTQAAAGLGPEAVGQGGEGERSPPRKRPGTMHATGGRAEASAGGASCAAAQPGAHGSLGASSGNSCASAVAACGRDSAGEVGATARASPDDVGGPDAMGRHGGQQRRRGRDGAVKGQGKVKGDGEEGTGADGFVQGGPGVDGSVKGAGVGSKGAVAGGGDGGVGGTRRRVCVDDLVTTRKHSAFQSSLSSSLPQPAAHAGVRGQDELLGMLDLALAASKQAPSPSKGKGGMGKQGDGEKGDKWHGALPALSQVLRELLHWAAPDLVEGLSWDGRSGGEPLWSRLASQALKQSWAWPLRVLLRPFLDVDALMAKDEQAGGAMRRPNGAIAWGGTRGKGKASQGLPGRGGDYLLLAASARAGSAGRADAGTEPDKDAKDKAPQVKCSPSSTLMTGAVAAPLAPCMHVLTASELRYGLGMARSTGHSARPEVRTENSYERQLMPLVILGGGPGAGGVPHPVAGSGFAEVGSLEGAKATLREAVQLPLLYPELFSRGALARHCKGVLLFGPPGTGKTMLARAVAAECGASFLPISMSHVSSKWVGDGVRIVRAAFSLAAKLAPCVIFVDEVDALLGKRDSASEHEAAREVKNEFMSQWDGFLQRRGHSPAFAGTSRPNGSGSTGGPPVSSPQGGSAFPEGSSTGGLSGSLVSSGASLVAAASSEARVIVLAATNRPFDLDDAVLRRFTKRVFCPLPDRQGRRDVLRVLTSEERLAPDVSLEHLAESTEGYSGSDLRNLCAEAAMGPLRALVAGWDRDERQRKQREAAQGSQLEGLGGSLAPLVSSQSDSALASALSARHRGTAAQAPTSSSSKVNSGQGASLSRTISVMDASREVIAGAKAGSASAKPSGTVMRVDTLSSAAGGSGDGERENTQTEPQVWPWRRRPRPRAINAADFAAALKKVPATVTAESTLLAELHRWNEMFGDGGNDRTGRPRLSYYM